MSYTRRSLLQAGTAAAALSSFGAQLTVAQTAGSPVGAQADDRVFICNEDSNTLEAVMNLRAAENFRYLGIGLRYRD